MVRHASSVIEVATLLKKFLAHGVNDILEFKPVILSVLIDKCNMPHVKDIRSRR
jgi:hypothetical protein